ncbi:Mut7-C RNAse domain-containing protein [Halorubrum sp. BV1]|uniref:Mut7-C RNAse domain-containing protein n=1 Tax=Halorubrum sp. BV1 TaxID=1498500 RepID=UPI000678B004|nr:Mut7-C RNAse domain-containing protein [Halorubrum sp. BV1]
MPPQPPTPAGEGPPRVLLDAMCGSLATYLRMCGYDAAYALDRGVEADDRLLALAADEDRTLITRDRDLVARAKRDGKTEGGATDQGADAVLLTERDVLDQLRELRAAGFPVELAAEPTRCGACNGPVERVDRRVDGDSTAGPIARPEYVPDDVGVDRPGWRCRDCGRWFWKGSHWADVAARLDTL